MRIEFDERLIIEGVALAAERMLSSDRFIDRIVDGILLRFEALTPSEAAKFLDVTARTLADNHVAWGLDKSVAFGPTNPRYFLSQIIVRMQQKIVAGRRPNSERLAA